LFVLCRDEALTRGFELLDQTHVSEHETGLRREVPYEFLPPLVHRIVRWHRHGQRSEQLSLVTYLHREVVGELGKPITVEACRRGRRGGVPRDLRGPQLRADTQPDGRRGGARRPCEDLGHARQHVVGGVCLTHAFGEV